MSIAYLGLGSNLGDRRDNIESAVELMTANDIVVLKRSSIIETDPVAGPVQGKYLNAVVKIETTLPPEKLLAVLNRIESQLGRERTVPNGPRTIDIDILLYDQAKIATGHLTIPHPRMHLRDFVLDPLREIEPGLFKEDLV